MGDYILQTEALSKDFVVKRTFFGRVCQRLRAMEDVSIALREGEIVGLVGESGCGKSTLGRVILKLHEPTTGKVYYRGEDITQLSEKEMLPYRRRMQLIFQDPYASLNPRMTIYETVVAPLEVFGIASPQNRRKLVATMLERSGLTTEYLRKYPHEMSGGQRQRVVIARAMITEPDFVICDEPVSALDVSVRAQILNLMKRMQSAKNTTYLFISHDLSVVHYLCDRIYVMYLGHIVEEAPKSALFSQPAHPYTQALLSAIPLPDVSKRRKRILLSGELPSPLNPPKGCRFHTRCQYATEHCALEKPRMMEICDGHRVACWNVGEMYERA